MQNKSWNFVSKFKYFICFSLLIIVVGIVCNIIFGVKLDINFKGGTSITYTYDGEVDIKNLETAVDNAIEYKVTISESQDYTTGTSSIVISVVGNKALNTDELSKIDDVLNTDDYKDNNFKMSSKNSVDATVGKSFLIKAVYALAISSILVIIYVGFRFRKIGGISAALTALFALVHDVAIVYFADVILGITLDANFIAVVLTILGYSLNDTIVIYDRVRENTNIYKDKLSHREIVNLSITQSFKRTLVTSISTFIAIFCVTVVAAIAGLTSIISFALPMCIGTVAGSYSSICLAGPLYVLWLEFKDKKGIGSKKSKKSKAPSYVNRKK